jgi:hypothetical protein
MNSIRPYIVVLFCIAACCCQAQVDSTLQSVQDIPSKYFSIVNKKIDKYSDRLTNKTEKTLIKLSRWENKIQKLLLKASPETAERLFAQGRPTFSSMLEKIKKGQAISSDYESQYNSYRDRLATSIKYVQSQKSLLDSQYLKNAKQISGKIEKLEEGVAYSEQIDQFIQERKKQLYDEVIKYAANNKYLKKINKEGYYYAQTLRNYKELFADPKKVEETAKNILGKIPSFQKFTKENSALAGLFGNQGSLGGAQAIAGLQTRTSINGIVEERLAAGGPNARQLFSQNMQQAQAEMGKLKDKIAKAGNSGSTDPLPDFKPNNQKSKTFLQRLEYGSNFQFSKNVLKNATADIGLNIGYKINDKSIIGVGAAYKMGMGSISSIRFTHEGVGLRSFADWKIKKQFFVSGGFEMNHNSSFKDIEQLKYNESWQKAALVGITKKFKVKTKLFKATNVQLLYDFLHHQHIPVSQPVLFRVGYTF